MKKLFFKSFLVASSLCVMMNSCSKDDVNQMAPSNEIKSINTTNYYEAYYSCDSLLALDESGNGYDLVNVVGAGAVLSSDRNGMSSSAYYFDGKSGFNISNSTILNQSSAQSVSLWFNASDPNNVLYGGTLFTISASKAAGTGSRFLLKLKEGHLLGVYGDGYNSADGAWDDSMKSTKTYNDSLWHNAVYVSQGDSGMISLYVDGKLEASKKVLRSNHNQINGLNMRLGGSSQNNFYKGYVDNVAYYGRALSANEVVNIYQK